MCASKQKREKLECYSCSRERRRLLFEEAKAQGCTTIAFGHHRDDSIQTLLMNLFHKAEFAANLPKVTMYDYGVTIIRPLILISEAAIKEFAHLYGFVRIMCQCPVGQNSMRRQVSQALSELEILFPNIRENLSQAGLKYGSCKATVTRVVTDGGIFRLFDAERSSRLMHDKEGAGDHEEFWNWTCRGQGMVNALGDCLFQVESVLVTSEKWMDLLNAC